MDGKWEYHNSAFDHIYAVSGNSVGESVITFSLFGEDDVFYSVDSSNQSITPG